MTENRYYDMVCNNEYLSCFSDAIISPRDLVKDRIQEIV